MLNQLFSIQAQQAGQSWMSQVWYYPYSEVSSFNNHLQTGSIWKSVHTSLPPKETNSNKIKHAQNFISSWDGPVKSIEQDRDENIKESRVPYYTSRGQEYPFTCVYIKESRLLHYETKTILYTLYMCCIYNRYRVDFLLYPALCTYAKLCCAIRTPITNKFQCITAGTLWAWLFVCTQVSPHAIGWRHSPEQWVNRR